MPSIGIRREDKSEWERRVPLDPEQVKKLIQQGIDVIIQPSAIRIFNDKEYENVGARIKEDMSSCNVVFGIKEFPISCFNDGQGYMFFSHVIKGQSYNMPMLQKILDKGCTLLDYEKVTDEKNRRLIFFGKYAGLAGSIESLFTLGKRLEWEGVSTPFLRLKRPLDYNSLGEATAALKIVGEDIKDEGLPDTITPLVIGFSGYGNVSMGAQEIVDNLPFEQISPEDLASFIEKGEFSGHKVYKVVFYEKDIVTPVDPSGQFELQEYYRHPEKYRGVFEQYLNHLTVLINCIYWTEDYPRLVTKKWLKNNWAMDSKLKVLGDISCDIEGSIECTKKSTDPGNPIFVYLPEKDDIVDGCEDSGPVVMAVDTLPCELPRESSTYFGNLIMPFINSLANVDLSEDFDNLQLPVEIKRAVIVQNGKFTPDFVYLNQYLR
jgi:alpha-aminoadipic semialdehyde synthase